MSKWQEIELAGALGMATNVVNPGRKYAQRILNMHTHEKVGALKLRPGYSSKYTYPSDSTITNSSFLTFETFIDKQADPAGQEITCLIQKGTTNGINNLGSPIVPDTLNSLNIWIRPYWNGNSWVDSWQWLNKIIITKIIDNIYSDTDPNTIQVFGNETQGLGDDSTVGWVIYNKTQNQYAKIITAKKDVAVNSAWTRISHTLYNSSWVVGDIIYIMKNYYDLTSLSEIYNCNWNDIVFHKINDDLRIGFGGQQNRNGMSIGYRKKYYLINTLNYGTHHADLDAAGVLQAFSTIDEVRLDEHIANGNAYGINLTAVSGTLPNNTYYFRLTVMLDNYEEHLVAENFLGVDGTQDIQVNPYIAFGKDNSKITRLKLYKSIDNITFYKINEYIVTDSQYNSTGWQINENGQLYLNLTPSTNYNPELYTEANAAVISGEANTIGSWVVDEYSDGTLSVDTPGAGGSSYSLKYGGEPAIGGYSRIKFPISGILLNRKYTISLYLKVALPSGTTRDISVAFFDAGLNQSIEKVLTIDGTFTQYTFTLDTSTNPLLGVNPSYFTIAHSISGPTEFFWADLISIKVADVITYSTTFVDGTEMDLELGYTPTYNLVKGWDKAFVYWGRVYYLNPYLDQRYENFLFVSIINQANAYLYDIANASNYRELEKFDGNKSIGLELLQDATLLVIKDKSSMSVDRDTGFTRDPMKGITCTTQQGVVKIQGLIMFPGVDDVFIVDGYNAKGTLENSIRDLYLKIADKTTLFAIADQYNSYRLRVNDTTNKTEYLFTEKGVIEENKNDFAQVYRQGSDPRLLFMDASGNIYINDNLNYYTPIPIQNQHFIDSSSWTADPGWTLDNGANFNNVGGGGASNLVQNINAAVGKSYVVVYRIDSISGAGLQVFIGTGAGVSRTVAGSYSEIITCAGNGNLKFAASIDAVGKISGIAIYEIN